MLDCVDEERSKLTYYDTVYLINEGNRPFRGYQALIDVKMRPETVGAAHAFRLKKATLKQVVDDVIVKAVKVEKIKGFRFVGLREVESSDRYASFLEAARGAK